MMKYIYSIFLVLYAGVLVAQNNSQLPPVSNNGTLTDIERNIAFIDLLGYENRQYLKSDQEVTRIIFQELHLEKVFAYHIDYATNNIKRLSKAEWKETLLHPYTAFVSYKYKTTSPDYGAIYRSIHYYRDGSYDKNRDIIFGPDSSNWERQDSVYVGTEPIWSVDITRIGFDQTTYPVVNGVATKVHYVNFYAYDDEVNPKPTPDYRFSLRWEDFLDVLDQSNKLYYTNTFSSWWRGNILADDGSTTMGEYAVDYLEFIKSHKQVVPYNFYKSGERVNMKNYLINKYWRGLSYEVFIKEKKEDNTYNIQQFGIEKQNINYSLTGERLVFNWDEIAKIAKDSSWRKRSELYTMADAFRLGKFVVDKELTFPISKNGKFQNGNTDALCIVYTKPSYPLEIPLRSFDTLSLKVKQGIYTEDPLNKMLTGEKGLTQFILSNVYAGKITAYKNDSLETILSSEQVHKNVRDIRAVRLYNPKYKYYKGNFVIDKNGTIYKTLINTNPYDSITADKFEKYDFKKIYPADSLSYLSLNQTIFFNEEGYNNHYKTDAIGINIPTTRSKSGYVEAVCYVKWEDLKALLIKNNDATLIEIIENRKFFSYIYETGVIEIPAQK